MFRSLLSAASLSRIATQRIGGSVCHSSSCLSLYSKFQSLSLNNYYKPTCTTTCLTHKPLGFSNNTSFRLFSKGAKKAAPSRNPYRRSNIKEKDEPDKQTSAQKRARQSVKRRTNNRAHKSLIKIRVDKVLESLELLENKPDAQPEDVVSVEELIREAHLAIDKAVKVGTLHRKTGARKKSRLARRKKAVEIHHGWYKPSPDTTA